MPLSDTTDTTDAQITDELDYIDMLEDMHTRRVDPHTFRRLMRTVERMNALTEEDHLTHVHTPIRKD